MKKLVYAFILCSMLHTSLPAQDCQITNNRDTTPGTTHFLGTIDGKAMMFKVNNQRSNYINILITPMLLLVILH